MGKRVPDELKVTTIIGTCARKGCDGDVHFTFGTKGARPTLCDAHRAQMKAANDKRDNGERAASVAAKARRDEREALTGLRECNTCKELRDYVHYAKVPRGRGGYKGQCKFCAKPTYAGMAVREARREAARIVREAQQAVAKEAERVEKAAAKAAKAAWTHKVCGAASRAKGGDKGCGIEKPRAAFPDRKGRPNGHELCRDCLNARGRASSAANPEALREFRAIRRAMEKGARTDGSNPTWGKLVKRDGLSCAYCGGTMNPNDKTVSIGRDGREVVLVGTTYPTFEHVIPISLDGPNTMGLGLAVCFSCNSERSDKTANLHPAAVAVLDDPTRRAGMNHAQLWAWITLRELPRVHVRELRAG